MEITEVRVSCRKTVSDGSYGNETVEVALTATVHPGEGPQFVAVRLAEQAHDTVLSRLRGSTNEQIRMALETPEERRDREEQQRAERQAELERWRVEREERRRVEEADEAMAATDDPDEGDADITEDAEEPEEEAEVDVRGSPF